MKILKFTTEDFKVLASVGYTSTHQFDEKTNQWVSTLTQCSDPLYRFTFGQGNIVYMIYVCIEGVQKYIPVQGFKKRYLDYVLTEEACELCNKPIYIPGGGHTLKLGEFKVWGDRL